MEKVQKVASGYVIPTDVFDSVCTDLADTRAKLSFIKIALGLIEEHSFKENQSMYGLDSIINDIIVTCDNTYEKLDG